MPCAQQVWKVNSKLPSVGSDGLPTILVYALFSIKAHPIHKNKEITLKHIIMEITLKRTFLSFNQMEMSPGTHNKCVHLLTIFTHSGFHLETLNIH